LLFWNVRGLNGRAHRNALRELVVAVKPSIVCLQETKLDVISPFDILQCIGTGFDYTFLPAMVYGPPTDALKPAFLAELQDLRARCSVPWLIAGDFNMIYHAEDKNNNRINRRLMGQFRRFLNDASLKELHLQGCLFTWSNERLHPMLERIDRAFFTADWEALHPNCDLHSLSSLCSDHAPLLLRLDSVFSAKKRFLFRSFWLRLLGFLEVVESAWHCPLRDASAFARLDWLLRNTARFLKSWSTRSVGSIRTQLELAKEVVQRLEMARDCRSLTPLEEKLRQELKLKSLGLSSLQRTIVRQESQLLWLNEGDAPTKFFHCHANHRWHKNFIHTFFNASFTYEVGNGVSTLFWTDSWLDGRRLAATMGELVEAVSVRRRNSRSVASALQDHAWISDLFGPFTVPVIVQFLQLKQRLQGTVLDPASLDRVVWKWCPSGQYSCSSAYQAFFLGQSALLGAKELWKVRAPNEYRLFFWLAIQDRCWTFDRLRHHGIRSCDRCALCSQLPETIDHLLLQCVSSREVWFRSLLRSGWAHLSPSHEDKLSGWWLCSRKLVAKF
ncbi:hypothetical protein BAE44_0014812, partial [Dichanthelium oligosanthes]